MGQDSIDSVWKVVDRQKQSSAVSMAVSIFTSDVDSSRSLVNGSQFYLARLIKHPRSPSTCGFIELASLFEADIAV
jgi:hypothetical protein